MEKDLDHYWAQLSPLVAEMQDVILTCPAGQRQFIALKVMGHFLGAGCAFMQQSNPELQGVPLSMIGKQIMESVVPMLDHAAKRARN